MTRSGNTAKLVRMALSAAVALAFALPAQALDIRIDYAALTTPTAANWNVVATGSGTFANLTNFDGSASNVTLTYTDDIGGAYGSANSWTPPPAFRDWIDPMAPDDYLPLVGAQNTGQLKFSGAGIDPTKTYRVEILGSRTGAGSKAGDYKIQGAFSDNLNSDGYNAYDDGYRDHQVMTWRQVEPNVSNEIVFDFALPAGAAASYLSAMRITDDSPPQTILVDYGHADYTTPGNWNNATSLHNGHKVLGAVDAAGQQTAVSVSILEPFQGVNTAGVVSDAAGLAAAAQRDSLATTSTATATVQIEGLAPGQRCDVTLFGSRQAAAGVVPRTDYTIGGTTQTLDNQDNAASVVTFSNVAADKNGHIQIDVAADGGATNGYLGAIELTGSFPVVSAPPEPSILFDFGSAAAGFTTSGDWSNVTNASASATPKISNAVDSAGNATTIGLVITDGLGGVNDIGEVSNDAGYPTSAQRDSFFVTPSDPGQFRLEGLVADGWYNLTFFGSRGTPGHPSGATSTEFQAGSLLTNLYVVGNTEDVAILRMVQADGLGQIVVDVRPYGTSTFGYFGALQIDQVPEPGSIVLVGLGLVGLFRRARRRVR